MISHPRGALTERGRVEGRWCMETALAWIDEQSDLAKLLTAIPVSNARWGLSVVPSHWVVAHRAGGGIAAFRDAARQISAVLELSWVNADLAPYWSSLD